MSVLTFTTSKRKADPNADLKLFKPEIERKGARVGIYRPGVEPEWVDDDQDDDLLANTNSVPAKHVAPSRRWKEKQPRVLKLEKAQKADVAEEVEEAQIISTGIEEVVPGDIDVSNLAVPEVEASDDEDEEDAIAARRARIRARLKKKEEEDKKEALLRQEQKGKTEDSDSSSSDSDSDSSSSSSDDDDDLTYGRPMMKPVFVSKKERATIAERERLQKEEEEAAKAQLERLKIRKEESTKMVLETIAREDLEQEAAAAGSDDEMPNTDDEEDDLEELEKWKLRELRRIKRDTDAREAEEKERLEKEKRRNMTDAEVEMLHRMDPAKQKKKEEMQFMQKYYHKGAFFQHEQKDQFKRNFMAPTGEDALVDKKILPKVMQVKKFGLKGRTKYTHLTDQDTTNFETNPWAEAEKGGFRKHKLAGTGSVYHRKKQKK